MADGEGKNVKFPADVDSVDRWVHELIERLKREGFYGDLNLRFREGTIYIAEKKETLKPS